MNAPPDHIHIRFAQGGADIRAAQHLRYEVFVQEMGASKNIESLERDAFDPYCDHLLLIDDRIEDSRNAVIGTYRLMTQDRAREGIGFYSACEYDLTPLVNSGLSLLELGRSCLRKAYRGGAALSLMWQALAQYVTERNIQLLFGTASFKGTDIAALSHALAFLHHNHLVDPKLRSIVHQTQGISMDIVPRDQINRITAVQTLPPLIKAYLRLGGCVGQGAYIDERFNTTDVLMILDTTKLSRQHHALYNREAG